MKIIVVGLGSMGKRRIRLLQKHFREHSLAGIDRGAERREYVKREYHIPVFADMEEAVQTERFDCAFVCTPPLTHQTIITECLNYGMHIFTEINLVDNGYQKNMDLAEKKHRKLFLSSSMIYREELQYLYGCMENCGEAVCYSYHVGQYLPDWHPWENYKDFFVGDKSTNGCREILAIELPWIVRAFGEIQEVKVQKTKLTKLEIDYDDCYMIMLRHKNGNMGTFIVDVVSREPVRMLRVFNEELYLEWNGEPDSLRRKDLNTGELTTVALYDCVEREKGYNKTIVENEYVNEMEQFFEELAGNRAPVYGMEQDREILHIIDRIEG